ncbi:MAG TPA: arsenate reductase ArsC [Planctomycetaceae bacterium]|nr:arsenate reductase ArsC [Planctomycetaceae bacterium]
MRTPIVLFLCTGNSVRSQMAEAFLRKHGGDRFEVHSAGLSPVGIHPFTIQVMNEVGLNLEEQRSKSVDEYLGKLPAKYVIFVCEQAEKSCPRIWPFAMQSFCWPFEDPAAAPGDDEEKLESFREIRDQIEDQIKAWLATEPEAADSPYEEESQEDSR